MPTPADLAGRAHRPPTARPTSTARPPATPPAARPVPFRRRWDIAVRHSNLHRNARLVALTLGSIADWQTGLIDPRDRMSLDRLSRSTALSISNIRVSLHCLGQAGWIDREPCNSDTVPSEIRLLLPWHARTHE